MRRCSCERLVITRHVDDGAAPLQQRCPAAIQKEPLRLNDANCCNSRRCVDACFRDGIMRNRVFTVAVLAEANSACQENNVSNLSYTLTTSSGSMAPVLPTRGRGQLRSTHDTRPGSHLMEWRSARTPSQSESTRCASLRMLCR